MAAHKIFGASNSVFASDFMISRASRMLTMVFDTTHISQLFSTVLYNLVYVNYNWYDFKMITGWIDLSQKRYVEEGISVEW